MFAGIDAAKRVVVVGKETDQGLNDAHIARYPGLVSVSGINGLSGTAEDEKVFAMFCPCAGGMILIAVVFLVSSMIV
jgi:hypothetical protein